MANRSFYPPKGALEIDVVSLYAEITIGASGAATLTSGKGIASVTKETPAGQYTLALSDNYHKLLWADAVVLDDTDSNPTTVGVVARILSEDVDNATAPEIVFQFYNFTDGSAANPANGAKVYVKIELRNSSVS